MGNPRKKQQADGPKWHEELRESAERLTRTAQTIIEREVTAQTDGLRAALANTKTNYDLKRQGQVMRLKAAENDRDNAKARLKQAELAVARLKEQVGALEAKIRTRK